MIDLKALLETCYWNT